MDNSADIVTKAFEHRSPSRTPRGELWLGTDLLKTAHLEDTLEGHRQLIKRLGQDIICLPLSHTQAMNKTLGYRYFNLKELKEASNIDDLFVLAVIDGPFQRLVEKRGLMTVLNGWKKEKRAFEKTYEQERREVDALIKQCLKLSMHAIIIADDIAGERAPFIDPYDIQDLFSSFYIKAISEIHSTHKYAMLHSCGNISTLIPAFVSYGFDGLAAVQHQTNDLISIKEKYGSSLTLMGGIDGELLTAGTHSVSSLKEYKRLVRSLAPGGGFIICSSSGLYSGDFLAGIQKLYQIADEAFTGNAVSG
ncbi:MAG: hypothetical protein JXA50_04425 [Deltaproteobacteria bacterium]|nr:hypothetical protein [Deltaproteobacteria bacterium]